MIYFKKVTHQKQNTQSSVKHVLWKIYVFQDCRKQEMSENISQRVLGIKIVTVEELLGNLVLGCVRLSMKI